MSGQSRALATADELNRALEDAPFRSWLPAVVTAVAADGSVELRVPWQPGWGNGGEGGYTHGGVLAALVDLAAECAVMAAFGAPAPTIDLSIRYLAPTREEALVARGSLIRKGRSVTVAEARVEREDGTLVATGSGGFATFTIAEG